MCLSAPRASLASTSPLSRPARSSPSVRARRVPCPSTIAVLAKQLGDPHLGSLVLSTLYISLAAGSLTAVPTLRWLGTKTTLFVGAFASVVFIAGLLR